MSIALWKSSFGDEYTDRNSPNLEARREIWKQILPGCQSVLEVGANLGQNLQAISEISGAELLACEPNDHARAKLEALGLCPIVTGDAADKIMLADGFVDLAFTCGVLIHIPPEKLEASMREIYRVSNRYIICGEYFAPSEEMIPYHGKQNAMWRRDYGSLYMDMFPDLKCTQTLFAWKRTTGLDNIMFWVMEK